MWVPERLVDVSLFVGEQDLETVAATLMRERALHVDAQESEHWAPAPQWAALADAYRGWAQRLDALRRALGLPDPDGAESGGGLAGGAPGDGDPRGDPRPSHDRLDVETAVLRFETRVGVWQDEMSSVETELAALTLATRQLELLRPLEAPVEALRDLRHQHVTIGTLPAENVERIAAALFQVAFVLLPLERRGPRTLVAIATAHEDAFVLERALRSAFFEPLDLPHHVRGLPPEALASVAADLAAAGERATELDVQRRALAEDVGPELSSLLARARLDAELCEALRRFPCRDGVYVIAGWMSQRRAVAVSQAVRAVATGPLVIETLPPGAGRRAVPSLVRNPRWLQPFEPLVTTFGLAGYDELNPTLIATIVFLFMYGMMFGDMGHGALLSLAGVLLTRKTRFGVVVAAAGAAAVVFGALYGVAFGATVMPALWLQPLHAIFPLLIASVVAGVAILNLGIVLNLVSAARNRDGARFWLDKSGVLGAALYWALLGGGLAVFGGLISTGSWLALVLPLAALMWLREPLTERLRGVPVKLGDHVITGFFELFEAVIAYLSNTLSFVRLGAFAVAHEGLSSMVLRYGSGPNGLATLVLGTLLIVGFEGLIVGIQALRLQYYEFFGRFFEGRGRPFHPLAFAGGPDAATPFRP